MKDKTYDPAANRPRPARFSFGNTVYESLSVVPAFFATSRGKIVTFSLPIIKSDTIPSLLGLTTLRRTKVDINVGTETLSSAVGWSASLFLRRGHPYFSALSLHDTATLLRHFRSSAPGHPLGSYAC